MAGAPIPSPGVSGSFPMTDREWDKLTNLVLERCVVPVIAPELLTWQEDGKEQSLYSACGKKLAEQGGVAFTAGQEHDDSYDVANLWSLKLNSGDLVFEIDDVMRRNP